MLQRSAMEFEDRGSTQPPPTSPTMRAHSSRCAYPSLLRRGSAESRDALTKDKRSIQVETSQSESRDAVHNKWGNRPRIEEYSHTFNPISIPINPLGGLSSYVNRFGYLPLLPSDAHMDYKESIADGEYPDTTHIRPPEHE